MATQFPTYPTPPGPAITEPTETPHRQLPIEAFSRWTVDGIRTALDVHELGDLYRSSLLVRAMGRDERITAVLDTRVKTAAKMPLCVEPNGTTAADIALADEVRGMLRKAIPEDVQTRILSDAVMLGASICQIRWSNDASGWRPTLEPWDMAYARYNPGFRLWQVTTMEGLVTIGPDDPNWFIFRPAGEYSFLAGAVRALGLPYLMRSSTYRDWVRYCEKHGLPIIAIEEPAFAENDSKAAFYTKVRSLGREAVLRMPKDANGQGFKAEFLEPSTLSYDAFRLFLERLDSTIAIRLLGQNLTTEVQGGSYAAADVHDRVRADIIEGDLIPLADQLRAHVVAPFVRFNVGEGVDPPRMWFDCSQPEDEARRSEIFARNSSAAVALVGAQIVTPSEARQLLGLEAQTPGGISPLAPVEARRVTGANVPPLPAPIPRLRAQLRDRNDGQVFVDAVADDARRRARLAFARDLERVAKALEAGDTYDEIRANLVDLFEKLDPLELASDLEKALIMGELAGRATVDPEA
jgi:phage gp29-like protein